MLNDLHKKNTEFVTKKDLDALIKQLTRIDKLQGRPGQDAVITPQLIKQILKLAKPIKGVDFEDGKPGVDGKTIIKEEVLTGDQIVERLGQASNRYSMPFSQIEDGHILLQKFQEVINNQNGFSSFATNAYDELIQLKEDYKAIDIQIQNPKQKAVTASLPDGFLSAVAIDCDTGIITFNVDVDGTPTPLTLDASCLKIKQECTTFDPTTEGIAEGFSDGSQWYNTVDENLFTFMCGNWIEIPTGTTVPTDQECDVLLDQAGNIVLDSNGNAILVNCTPVTQDCDVLLDQAGNVVLDSNGNAILINC